MRRNRAGIVGIAMALAAVSGAFVGTSAVPAAADVTRVDGGAAGLSLDLSTNFENPSEPVSADISSNPSVTLPSDGTSQHTAVSNLTIPGTEGFPPTQISLGSIGAVELTSAGGNLGSHAGFASSSSTLAGVDMLEAYFDGIHADRLRATCTANGDGTSGHTELSGLVIFGNTIPDSASRGEVFNLGLEVDGKQQFVRAVTNEQNSAGISGQFAQISVNAVHIVGDLDFPTGEFHIDAVLGQTQCGVSGPDVLQSGEPGAPGPQPGPQAPSPAPPSAAPAATAVMVAPHFTG